MKASILNKTFIIAVFVVGILLGASIGVVLAVYRLPQAHEERAKIIGEKINTSLLKQIAGLSSENEQLRTRRGDGRNN